MSEQIEIVELKEKSEVSQMIPLFVRYMEFYQRDINEAEFQSYFESIIEDERVFVFLAQIAGKPAGLMVVYRSFSSFECGKILFLNDLWVEPDFRTRGVGQALMDKVKSLARETGCKRVDLQTDLKNKKARKLYENSGMVADTEFINYAVKIT